VIRKFHPRNTPHTDTIWNYDIVTKKAWWEFRPSGDTSISLLSLQDMGNYVKDGLWEEMMDPDLLMDEGL
jgi:hypothetical protein